MEIALTWMPIVLGALTLAAAIAVTVVLLTRRAARRRAAPIAHSDRLTALPRFRRVLAAYRALLAGLIVVVILAVLTIGAVASRPVSSKVTQFETYNRDIVLCLDVSGSMVDYDALVLESFEQLVDEFDGERIALVLWNSSSAQVFPLTDDYDYLKTQLASVREGMEGAADFNSSGYSYWNGTLVADGASLIGDGLASCVLRFDRMDDARSRTIILATDNEINGEPILTFEEAADFAVERGVRVFGINPLDFGGREAEEFERLMEVTDGGYYTLDDEDAVPAIVDGVLEDQATVFESAPVLEFTDVPQPAFGWAVFAFALLLVIGWRVRL